MFNLNKLFLPLRFGKQFLAVGAGGPSGFANGTAQITPWPYRTLTRNFLANGTYGSASTLAAPQPFPYQTGSMVLPIQGYTKKPTYNSVVF